MLNPPSKHLSWRHQAKITPLRFLAHGKKTKSQLRRSSLGSLSPHENPCVHTPGKKQTQRHSPAYGLDRIERPVRPAARGRSFTLVCLTATYFALYRPFLRLPRTPRRPVGGFWRPERCADQEPASCQVRGRTPPEKRPSTKILSRKNTMGSKHNKT